VTTATNSDRCHRLFFHGGPTTSCFALIGLIVDVVAEESKIKSRIGEDKGR